jgi:hypothetical protein
VREPELSVLLFRRLGWEAADYWQWGQRLLDEQVALVLPSHWQGETVARIVLLNPRSELADVAAVLETMG